ncbi:MAG: TonB-dependent receptor [Candidatus Eremiobacteraeota bacterium]|nr:TonB-dependent receptor [Candidatus Eremiobacteraeota bacterium]
MLVALLLSVTFLVQGTWALAGTTGSLSGTVTDSDSGAPVANAKVTASSPSQTVSIQTDNGGHFLFISLIPDTYTVSIEKDGYDTASQSGLAIFADATQTYGFKLHKSLKTIAQVTSRSAGNLVKPGQTADVYSVNATTQDKVSALGGGGSLNSAYSAIASVPGAFVPLNQTGYFQTVHIRGGDYDQVGYELDGVPVNRAFDNYPSGAASSLGQQELQVYTGATPANSEGQGLAGYINQVIRTGTFPGFGLITSGVGAPTFYHKLAAEVGGATPNRNFSYYAGVGGYNQEFRYVDNNNAAGYTDFGPPAALTPCPPTGDISNAACYASGVGPGGYVLYPYQFGNLSSIANRDTIVNLHFGLPHKNDGLRDDIQLLWDSGYLLNSYYSSTNDTGGAALLPGSTGPHLWSDSFQWSGPVGVLLPANYQSLVSPYYYPNSPPHAFGDLIPANYRDVTRNTQEVVKLQYQKNLNPNAYVRAYGYTYYSDWLQNGPNSAFFNYIGSGASPDYELSSHTRGASLQFVDQINEKHLLSALGSYTTSTTLRDNNTQMFNSGGVRSRAFVLVDSTNPLDGVCYRDTGTATALATTCSPGAPGGVRATFQTWAHASTGSITTPVETCGAGPCAFLVAENSQYATYNTVTPIFQAYSLTDQWRPTDKLLINIGLRNDIFQFNGSDTRPNDPARTFWFTAWNLDHCVDPTTGRPLDKVADLGLTPTSACPTPLTAANMVNESSQVSKYNAVQPRLGATYTLSPDTVLRASWGKYVEPPNSAFEQYNTLQENLPNFLGTAFYGFGFTTPGHLIRPPTSYNADFSLEQHIRGTDWSLKVTPFLRKTKDQIQQFFLDQASGFVSGLNVGRQTSKGVELQVNKGDFSRDGLSGQLAFTYTNSYINYDLLQNGTTIVSGMNASIAAYNAFTKSGGGAPCYTSAGAPDPACAAGSIANPYYNDSPKALLDPGANYPTYDLFPGPIGSSAQAFGAPYVTTLILNYKHDKWAITPSLQFQAGARYGAPLTTAGIDPTSGCAPLAGSTAGDPRYPYGAAGGAPYDATTCGGTITIPNTFTHNFDNLGSFVQPSQLVGNVQVRYDVSQHVTLVGTFANVVNSCFGGSKEPWTVNDHNVCSYSTLNNAGAFPPVGNVYNPGASFQRLVQYPYGAYLGAVNVDGNSTKTPFNFFLEARIKM